MYYVLCIDSFGCAYEWLAHVPLEAAWASIELYLGDTEVVYARVVEV